MSEPHRTRNLAGCSEPGTSEPLGTCSGGWFGGQLARNLEPWILGTSTGGQNFQNAPPARPKIFVFDLDLEPRPENLEPRAAVATATGATDRGTWNLEPTLKIFEGPRLRRGWNLEPLPTHAGPSEPEPRNPDTRRLEANICILNSQLKYTISLRVSQLERGYITTY